MTMFLSRARSQRLFMLLALGIISVLSAPGVTSDETDSYAHELNIVALFPMTGPGASLGTFMNEGAQLAREDLEARHPGLRINVKVLDSRNLPKEAVTRLHASLAQDTPDAIITALSPVTRAIKPIAEEAGIVTVIISTVMENLAHDTEHLVRIYSTAEDFAKPVAAHARKHYRTVGVIQLQDEFGMSLRQAFERAMEGRKTRVLEPLSYEMLQRDTRSLVMQALDDSPEAIYVIGYGPAYINIIKQLRELSPDTQLLADNTFSDPVVLKALGDAANGVIFNGIDAELDTPTRPEVSAFRQRYIARYGRAPFATSVFAYDAVQTIVQAAQKDEGFRTPRKADIIALSPIKGIMGEVHIDPSGESRFPFMLMRRHEGRTLRLGE